MQKIDVRGKMCPEPLIITKRAIKSASADEQFEVISDNDVAACNLEGLLREMGITFERVDEGGEYRLLFSLNGVTPVVSSAVPTCSVPAQSAAGREYVVVLSSNSMGGDAELGVILMRGCINSLVEQDILPKTMVLYNSGVMVAVKGSDTAATLKELSDRGVEIILCGVCVDFFGIRDEIVVGRISNMMEITKVTTTAQHIVYP